MSYVADLHIHSPYAYATSSALTLENLAAWARLKGIDLLASADFTHPIWFEELRRKLEPASPGLYRFGDIHFILGTEVSCVYRQGGRQRRVHILLFLPDFESLAALNAALATHGNLASDGRPTLRLSARDLTELALEINPECVVVPAHVWTPWYGLYGSKSGFDHLEECFLDMTPHIHAVETGLSSDPAMNWPVSELRDKTILSFSDAHSLPKLGRELTVFEGDLSYPGFAGALVRNQVAYTVEFYPEEGKYHYNGHRKCGVRQAPEDTERQGSRCPVCGRPLTLGVLHRVATLSRGLPEATRGPDGFIRSPEGRPPFVRLLPLLEIIAALQGVGPGAKKAQAEYHRVVAAAGSELAALLQASAADLEAIAGPELGQAIMRARVGDVVVDPGYDGVFGKIVFPSGASSFGESASSGEGHSPNPRSRLAGF